MNRLSILHKRLKINQLLLASHLILVLWLIIMFSYSRYQSEWDSRISHRVELAEMAFNPLINTISPIVAGLNYTVLGLPSSLELFSGVPFLRFFEVKANSDYSKSPFGFVYSEENNDIWYTSFTKQDETIARQKIATLEERLAKPKSDKIKLNFLLSRAKDRLKTIVEDRSKMPSETSGYQQLNISPGEYYLDSENQALHLKMSLRNKNGGEIWAVFDASHLLALKTEIIESILREALFALVISTLLILWATRWIVRPIKHLADSMDRELHEIDLDSLNEKERNDEIGTLARCFDNLIKRIRCHIGDLEKLSYQDALTGLGSRHLYQTQGPRLIKKCRRSGDFLGVLVCDIDNFKRYNDTLGHLQGDEALKMVSQQIAASVQRETDMVFRVGGEEFVVLVQASSPDDVVRIGEKIRTAVLEKNILHPENPPVNKVSLSIGVKVVTPHGLDELPVLTELFEQADQALYRAKANGRNRLEVAVSHQATTDSDSELNADKALDTNNTLGARKTSGLDS